MESVLNDEEIDGVVIAAPAALHFQLAAKCLLHDKDAAKSQRVMQAMMQMDKIDIAGLERAHAHQ